MSDAGKKKVTGEWRSFFHWPIEAKRGDAGKKFSDGEWRRKSKSDADNDGKLSCDNDRKLFDKDKEEKNKIKAKNVTEKQKLVVLEIEIFTKFV